jgi:predicted Zn-dependent protease with MMP-like domain
MTLGEFSAIVEKALKTLPKEFQNILKEKQVGIVMRSKMPKEVRNKYPGQVVFGMFIGVTYGHFTIMQTEPTRIELYKESFELHFKDEKRMKQEIAKTVLHEVGHYFGFTEKRLHDLHLG